MFRPMRRTDRQLTSREAEHILKTADHGVLSLHGDDGYPYGVPVNFVYAGGKLYFHATNQCSHKLDAMRRNEKVCLTVVSDHRIILEELTTSYESVIVFGSARILEAGPERDSALQIMMDGFGDSAGRCHTQEFVMVEITPHHITGKARRDPR